MFFPSVSKCASEVGNLGLKNLYETDVEFNTLVKSLPCLAFVSLVEVEERFNELAALFPDEENVQLLLFYFESTYIIHRGVGGLVREARFPPEDWNFFLSAGQCLPKTTNCVEGFHNALKSMFLCQHTTIWTLFVGLRRDIATHRLTLQQALMENPEPPRRKYVELIERLARKVNNYFNEDDKLLYLRYVAHIPVAV